MVSFWLRTLFKTLFFYVDDDDVEIPHVDDELFLARALQVSLLLF